MKIKAEVVIAELNRLRADVDKDMTDPEYFALHHALCFISYKMGDFQRYLDEVVKEGEHPGLAVRREPPHGGMVCAARTAAWGRSDDVRRCRQSARRASARMSS